MIRPTHLKGEAAKFWTRNAKRLIESGILTEDGYDGFVHLCELHSYKCGAIPDSGDSKERIWFLGLSKQYQALLKQYGLLPRDRKRSEMEPEQDIADVLRGKMERR